MFYLVGVDGIFSFLQPIITFLEELGHVGLAIYTLLEVLLIIPPIETIYYSLIAINPDEWYLYFINVVVFNVIASMIGYVIGYYIGRPVLRFLTNEAIVTKAENLFKKYGVLAVAIGAFTPIPYTIVVFLGGITKMDFKKFVLAGFLGRFPRYLVGGYALAYILDSFDSELLNQYTIIVTVVGMMMFILFYIGKGFYDLYRSRV